MFDQSAITSVSPPLYRGTQVWIAWTSSAPAGTTYQVYLDHVLSYSGRQLACWLPAPVESPVRVDIGTVGIGEETTNFAAELPPAPGRHVTLTWTGGTFESPTLAGFYVYASPSPGAPVSYTKPLATITAFPGGVPVASGTFSWTSDPLISGVWSFAVVPFDTAGNSGTPATLAQTIAVPPLEVPPFSDQTRLHYTLNGTGLAPASLPTATLTWNPTPG